jgi:hypothetical protein
MAIRQRRKSSGTIWDFIRIYLPLPPTLDRRVGKQVDFIQRVVQINPTTGRDYQML